MNALRAAALAAGLCAVMLAPAARAECGQALPAAQRQVLTRPGHELAFALQPAQLAVGRHFGIDIVVCPRGGASLPVALRVDADMPAHRHGMNYKATVRTLGDGRYRADGLMLHMPGQWRLLFDLSADGRIERFTHAVDLK